MKDFFISYNQKDRQWAEWIAWQLEEAGFTTVIQAWDFTGNWVLQMDNAMRSTDRTIAVLFRITLRHFTLKRNGQMLFDSIPPAKKTY